ncbi:MAG: T9SS type A sorting domain-containing protein [Saprospiraceae bacterium]|nr:T9SS type A sorting domain-containing protein [Saprospiraceae bacterium]
MPIKPDSIRFSGIKYTERIDRCLWNYKNAWKNYEVLREKAEVISEAKVFIKVLGLWVDLFAIAGGNIPEGFGNILGKDTTISYNSLQQYKKEAIVSAEYTPDGTFLGSHFIDDGTLTSSVDLTAIDTRFKIYPNPASEYIDIEIGETSTSYTCLVSDMSGSYVHFDIILSGNAARLNTMDWPDGLYLIQLFSPSGKMSFLKKSSKINGKQQYKKRI